MKWMESGWYTYDTTSIGSKASKNRNWFNKRSICTRILSRSPFWQSFALSLFIEYFSNSNKFAMDQINFAAQHPTNSIEKLLERKIDSLFDLSMVALTHKNILKHTHTYTIIIDSGQIRIQFGLNKIRFMKEEKRGRKTIGNSSFMIVLTREASRSQEILYNESCLFPHSLFRCLLYFHSLSFSLALTLPLSLFLGLSISFMSFIP